MTQELYFHFTFNFLCAFIVMKLADKACVAMREYCDMRIRVAELEAGGDEDESEEE